VEVKVIKGYMTHLKKRKAGDPDQDRGDLTRSVHMSETAVTETTEYVLSRDKVPYSRSQRELFALIPKNGDKIKSTALAKLKAKKHKWIVDNPNNAVSVHMIHLQSRINANKEPFELMKTDQHGPYPVEYWIVKRRLTRRRTRR